MSNFDDLAEGLVEIKVKKALYKGILPIGDIELDCVVLEDERRILSTSALQTNFYSAERGLHVERKERILSALKNKFPDKNITTAPKFLGAENLVPFIDEKTLELLEPIEYLDQKSQKKGYDAELLTQICWVFMEALSKNKLKEPQIKIAQKAKVILKAISLVGITALVDEATGYQYIRDKNALFQVLENYIAKELLPWTKKFPDEFYEQMFRLRSWKYPKIGTPRPSIVGKWTNEIVYERMPCGVLDELRNINPKDSKGRFRNKHHQYLTQDIGNKHLEKHLVGVIALMRACDDWEQFMHALNKSYPKNDQITKL